MCQYFSGKMGYQGLVLEARFKIGRIMEFLIFLTTESRHAHTAGGSNVVIYGLY